MSTQRHRIAFVVDCYDDWEGESLQVAREKFSVLPQRFVELMEGLHELAGPSHKLTLNEYCRKRVVFSNLAGEIMIGSRNSERNICAHDRHFLLNGRIDCVDLAAQTETSGQEDSREHVQKENR
jgi:hypothetical protein